ncbi:uncharacterized protein LOC111381768 isoform X3 [Olea europaea var. sylvestris]|uniref:uncharacterized protein LOC111381768 isoform X3 n=1 Tax=Olea europaea var. sylvestris TaxID=158386 RepID=UPI000C1CE9E4|nr:uncharacterized protein LOC111381768 isoform X3 [Olea europaea var. sylvestris]
MWIYLFKSTSECGEMGVLLMLWTKYGRESNARFKDLGQRSETLERYVKPTSALNHIGISHGDVPNSSQPQRNQKIRRGKDNKNITWLIGLGKQKPVLEFQVGILK